MENLSIFKILFKLLNLIDIKFLNKVVVNKHLLLNIKISKVREFKAQTHKHSIEKKTILVKFLYYIMNMKKPKRELSPKKKT